jgi:flagellar hook-associated protein 2
MVYGLHSFSEEGAMGTVGLSFGSPTSGAGFDVSSTVASIVGNLRNVENPWNTQLTELKSQDTAISSLGTLFSNLSNDLSSLTDFQGIMAQKEGSSSDQNVLTLTAANSTAVAGTHAIEVTNLAKTSSGYLAPVSSASAPLAGSITLQVGSSGTAQTITLNSSDNTLTGLAAAINSSGVGVAASVLTDSSGSRLSLVSGTSGAQGNIQVSANSIGSVLGYTGTAGTATVNSSGTLASIANAGDTLSGSLSIQVGSGTAENVVIGAAPATPAANTIYTGSGVNTLAGIAGAITSAGIGVGASVVTNSDGSSSLQLVSGTTGTSGTLTVNSSVVDSTTSMLGYTSAVTGKDANLTVDGVALTSASNTVANLIPGVTFQLLAPSATESDGSLEQVQVVIANNNSGVESAVATTVSDYNSLVSALNTQEGNDSSGNPEPLFGSPTLSLLQQQLFGGLNMQSPNGALDSIKNASDTLSGSLSIQVGSGAAENIVIGAAPSTPAANTVYTGDGVNTLAGLASAINSAGIGVTANVVKSSTGSQLELVSNTVGTSGALTVSSALTDETTSTTLGYTSSGSDINSLTSLGISLNNDGTLTLDTTSLDSVLNSDYSSVVGFFQNSNGWGQNFSNILTNSGTSSPTGVLALSASSNSSVESTLNADISKEESQISAEQKSLTAELTSANEIMQMLPSQLQGVNELYSAVTGYNQNGNG